MSFRLTSSQIITLKSNLFIYDTCILPFNMIPIMILFKAQIFQPCRLFYPINLTKTCMKIILQCFCYRISKTLKKVNFHKDRFESDPVVMGIIVMGGRGGTNTKTRRVPDEIVTQIVVRVRLVQKISSII